MAEYPSVLLLKILRLTRSLKQNRKTIRSVLIKQQIAPLPHLSHARQNRRQYINQAISRQRLIQVVLSLELLIQLELTLGYGVQVERVYAELVRDRSQRQRRVIVEQTVMQKIGELF